MENLFRRYGHGLSLNITLKVKENKTFNLCIVLL